MKESKLRKAQRKTQKQTIIQKDAKHRGFVLQQWLKTQINFNEDIKASIVLIKPKMLQYKLIDQIKANKLFPYFDEMLKISDIMIEIISSFKTQNINNVMIGSKLNKVVSYYKIYLEYFKHKSEIKAIYESLQKTSAKQLRIIETQLRAYFDNFYREKQLTKSKLSSLNTPTDTYQKPFNNPKSNITIHDCLQRPLYRLFKYHLLIDSYLKKLPPTHQDYEPLKKTKQLFVQIGQKCNNSFTEQEKQDLKFKLQQLYGRSLPQNSHYKTEMSAQTLYFPCKLYIFTNLIIISKAQKMIGFRQQKLFMNLGIDQFSFISYKKDMKYFKSILMICGIYDCLHLFLPDKGTRLQIHNLVSKMIQQQKMKAFQKRQHKQAKQTNKLTFLLDEKQNQTTSWLTGIKVQVVDIDMRELGMFTNDTVFILSVCIPQYIDDEATFLKTSQIIVPQEKQRQPLHHNFKQPSKQNIPSQYINRDSMTKQEHVLTSKIGPVQYKKLQSSESQFVKSSTYSTLNQHIQIDLSLLIQIYKDLQQRFPEINFPQIDPFSKDFNFYTQSKKKTKSFEVRSFLIEQFFNFVFRHPSIMENPISIVSKLKIDEYLWDYVVARSFYIQNQRRDGSLNPGQTAGNKYDHNHCRLCKDSVLQSIQKFQVLRQKMVKLQMRRPDNYCFNFYNLLRNSLLAFNPLEFNTVQRMLLYIQYYQGRLDYAFLFKKNLAKVSKVIKIRIAKLIPPQKRQSQEKSLIFHTELQVSIDHKTTVGMVVSSISKDTEIINMFDYRMVVVFNGLQRILGQDEYVYDLIDKYELSSQEQRIGESELEFVGPRNSYKEPSVIKSTMGMISMIRNWLPINKNQSLLYLRKMLYFPLYLQMQSITKNFNRSQMIIAQVLDSISKTQNGSTIPLQVWGQVCGLYYCLCYSKQLLSTRASINTDTQTVSKCCAEIVPQQNISFVKNDAFVKKLNATINQRKKYIVNLNNQNDITFKSSINQRLLELSYKYFKVNNKFVPVEAKKVPQALVLVSGVAFNGSCVLGVNHSEIIVLRDRRTSTQAIRISLQDVEIVHSVYSLFLTYRRQGREQTLQVGTSQSSKTEQFQLRFDSKMLHGFVQLCQKYKLLKSKFSLIYDEYQSYSN